MLEIEVKYRAADFVALTGRLHALGAACAGEHLEADTYYAAPDRDLKATGEVFRLRRVGHDGWLSYKGARLPGPAKTRPEIEAPLAPGPAAAALAEQIFAKLGYRVVAVVRKVRRAWTWRDSGFELHACLDELDGIGRFAEVEIVTEPARRADAEAALARAATTLGLTTPEPRSYLELHLHAMGAR